MSDWVGQYCLVTVVECFMVALSRTATGRDDESDHFSSRAMIASTSMAAPRGRAATWTALRAG